jgi:hypothetical protein
MTTPKTASPELVESQADKEEAVNEGLRRVEAGAGHYRVEDRNLTAPPGACADGATYIISGPSPTGAWAGEDGNLAIAVGVNASNGWYIIDAEDGMTAWVKDESTRVRFDNATSPSSWILDNSAAGTIALDDLTDVDTSSSPGKVDGDILTWNASAGLWVPGDPPTPGATTLDDLTDVFATAPTDEDFLQYESSPQGWYAKSRAVADVGYLGSPQISDQDDYTFVLSDAGKHYYHPSSSSPDNTVTIPANASVPFPIGTVLLIINENGAGSLNIAITSDTLRWGSSTGARTLAANGVATAIKVAATTWRLTGDGIT